MKNDQDLIGGTVLVGSTILFYIVGGWVVSAQLACPALISICCINQRRVFDDDDYNKQLTQDLMANLARLRKGVPQGGCSWRCERSRACRHGCSPAELCFAVEVRPLRQAHVRPPPVGYSLAAALITKA